MPGYQYSPMAKYGYSATPDTQPISQFGGLLSKAPELPVQKKKEDPILEMLLNRGKAEAAGDVGAGIMGFGNSLRSDAMGARNQDIETGSNGVSNIQAMLQQLESTYKNRQAMNQRMAGISAMGGR